MKRTNYLLTLFSILIIVIGILIFFTCWTNETKSLITQYSGVLVTGFGFIIAIYQLRLSTKQYLDDIKKKEKDYLDLSIETKYLNDFYSLRTQVINKSREDKDIDYSFILISKQEDDILEKIQSIDDFLKLNEEIGCSNDFIKLKDKIEKPLIIDNSVCIIPLEFYFSENIRIGNENPSYTFSFHKDDIKLNEGIYSVRFYIFPKNGYHRSTVDSLILK